MLPYKPGDIMVGALIGTLSSAASQIWLLGTFDYVQRNEAPPSLFDWAEMEDVKPELADEARKWIGDQWDSYTREGMEREMNEMLRDLADPNTNGD